MPRISKRHSTSTDGSADAFTLIELLVVIAIIAILASLAFPAVQGALNSGKKAQARNDVQQIVAAIKAYQLEYGKLPTQTVSSDNQNEQWIGDNKYLIDVLIGSNSDLNPRNIVFFEPKMSKGTNGGRGPDGKFYDPWGTMYAIKLDTGYNNQIEYYGTNIITTAIAISFGPNRTQDNPFASGSDEIVSFK